LGGACSARQHCAWPPEPSRGLGRDVLTALSLSRSLSLSLTAPTR
jgi:hypothetical protein